MILSALWIVLSRCAMTTEENQDVGVFQYGAGDGETLPLAARKFHAAVADIGPVAFGRFGDEAVGIGDSGRLDDLLVRSSGLAHGDVALDGVVEKHGVLRYDAHVGAHALLRVVADRNAVDEDVARRKVSPRLMSNEMPSITSRLPS